MELIWSVSQRHARTERQQPKTTESSVEWLKTECKWKYENNNNNKNDLQRYWFVDGAVLIIIIYYLCEYIITKCLHFIYIFLLACRAQMEKNTYEWKHSIRVLMNIYIYMLYKSLWLRLALNAIFAVTHSRFPTQHSHYCIVNVQKQKILPPHTVV